jgi:hypothetical protein
MVTLSLSFIILLVIQCCLFFSSCFLLGILHSFCLSLHCHVLLVARLRHTLQLLKCLKYAVGLLGEGWVDCLLVSIHLVE